MRRFLSNTSTRVMFQLILSLWLRPAMSETHTQEDLAIPALPHREPGQRHLTPLFKPPTDSESSRMQKGEKELKNVLGDGGYRRLDISIRSFSGLRTSEVELRQKAQNILDRFVPGTSADATRFYGAIRDAYLHRGNFSILRSVAEERDPSQRNQRPSNLDAIDRALLRRGPMESQLSTSEQEDPHVSPNSITASRPKTIDELARGYHLRGYYSIQRTGAALAVFDSKLPGDLVVVQDASGSVTEYGMVGPKAGTVGHWEYWIKNRNGQIITIREAFGASRHNRSVK